MWFFTVCDRCPTEAISLLLIPRTTAGSPFAGQAGQRLPAFRAGAAAPDTVGEPVLKPAASHLVVDDKETGDT
jgi:hypothetical protein